MRGLSYWSRDTGLALGGEAVIPDSLIVREEPEMKSVRIVGDFSEIAGSTRFVRTT